MLLSSPIVAVLSLPLPPPSLPPSLADHDLGRQCEAPRRLPPLILHATPHHVCHDQQGQHCSRGHCLSTRSVFEFICLGLAMHLLGNDLIHGLDIRAGIESLVSGFGWHAIKKRAAFSTRSSTFFSFLLEDMLKCYRSC